MISKECYRVVIDPGVLQFLSGTIRLISNRTHAAHKFNFEITHMTQTELHSIRFNYHC